MVGSCENGMENIFWEAGVTVGDVVSSVGEGPIGESANGDPDCGVRWAMSEPKLENEERGVCGMENSIQELGGVSTTWGGG